MAATQSLKRSLIGTKGVSVKLMKSRGASLDTAGQVLTIDATKAKRSSNNLRTKTRKLMASRGQITLT